MNPSDIALLIGAADVQTAVAEGTAERSSLRVKIHPERMAGMRARLGNLCLAGNEGAGARLLLQAPRRAICSVILSVCSVVACTRNGRKRD